MILKILLWVYGICLIPTLLAISIWPEAYKEIYEERLSKFGFFLSVWLVSPVLVIYVIYKRFK